LIIIFWQFWNTTEAGHITLSIIMAHRPPVLSRTLPKNFTFPSVNSSGPKTPEHPSTEPQMPPAPRHASCRLSRPRVNTQMNIFAGTEQEPNIFSLQTADVALPSIEFPPPSDIPESIPLPVEPVKSVRNDRLQVPSTRQIIFKTPPAQIRTTPISFPDAGRWAADDPQGLGHLLERPGSACSMASDSSLSSISTLTTQPSLGGSCTSPESDVQDPFGIQLIDSRKLVPESPAIKMQRTAKVQHRTFNGWTAEMDNHLWNTYQIYLQDPTITPFKTLPGSLPPLGVTHRVAREAKRTWPRVRTRASRPSWRASAQVPPVPDSGATISKEDNPLAETRSGSTTPTAHTDPTQPNWPRSEATTRKRLRFLCKRKISIAPHYQRLLQSRSPSPFLDTCPTTSRQFSRSLSRSDPLHSGKATFTTRDLGVSLISSSLPSTLTQLAAVSHPDVDDGHFNGPEVQPIHEETTTRSAFETGPTPPRLGSPFKYNTWGPDTSRRALRSTTSVNRHDTIHVTGVRLRSPSRRELAPNAHKRRAQHQIESSPTANGIQRNIQDLIRGGKLKDGQRRVRIRNRGNTMGAVNSKERIEHLFSSTPHHDASEPDVPTRPPSRETAGDLHLDGESIRRLGSPFQLDIGQVKPPMRYSRHAPSLSDPFIGGSAYAPSYFTSQNSWSSEQAASELPYDPTEPGISDAERIRRQILNLPFTRKQS